MTEEGWRRLAVDLLDRLAGLLNRVRPIAEDMGDEKDVVSIDHELAVLKTLRFNIADRPLESIAEHTIRLRGRDGEQAAQG